MFANAFKKHKYEGKYNYCYCTKSSHFSFIVEEALKNDIHLETSYAYDIDIVNKLYARRKIHKDTFIICNGYKQKPYTTRISKLLNTGFKNVIPILDNKEELKAYKSVKTPFKLGIRVAAEEEPNFPFYTSRLGMRAKDVLEFYVDEIEGMEHKYQLKMLHIYTPNPLLKNMIFEQICRHRYTDSGFDIPLVENTILLEDQYTFEFDIRVAATDMNENPLPCLLLPRSSISSTPFRLANSIGLIDAGYRGELIARVDCFSSSISYEILKNRRLFQVCQYNFLPWKEIIFVDNLEDLPAAPDNRGEGGFGSTN
jgi:dUTPase